MTTSATTSANLDRDIEDARLLADYQARGGKKKLGHPEYGTPLYWALAREADANKKAARERKKAQPVHPTHLNISALADLVMEHHGRNPFPNRVQSTSVPHVKRCVDGGLVKIANRGELELTPAGIAAMKEYMGEELARLDKHQSADPYYIKRDNDRRVKLGAALAGIG